MREEIDCGILYIDVNGFRTKNAVTGYDALYHSLLKNLIEPKQIQSKPFVNLVSVSENPRNTAAIADLLGRLDIPCNIIPRFSGIRAIRRAGSAVFSVSLNDGENEYLMTGLEESFGVPWLRTNPPVGTAAVYDFIKKAAAKFSPEAAASAGALIEKEERQARLSLSKKPFAGKRIFLDMDLHLVVSFSSLVDELGGEVSGIAIPYLDSGNREKLKELAFLPPATPVIIAQGQQFEIANLLYKSAPDFYIGKSARAAARLGINALEIDRLLYYGYAGVGETVRRAAGANSVYAELLKEKEKNIYSDAWLKRSGNWYVKVEVK
jgi:nitrogenase molybdenum-iron protein alpha chain